MRWRELWRCAALLAAVVTAAAMLGAAVWTWRESQGWRLAGMCFLPGMGMAAAMLARAMAGGRPAAECRVPGIAELAERCAGYQGLAKRGA